MRRLGRCEFSMQNWKAVLKPEDYRWYCVLCTVYCVLCTVYCVLCTVYCVLCTVYCVLCTVYCVLCTVYCVFLQRPVQKFHGRCFFLTAVKFLYIRKALFFHGRFFLFFTATTAVGRAFFFHFRDVRFTCMPLSQKNSTPPFF